MIQKINSFFFPIEEDEKLSLHDVFFFYGGLTFFIVGTVFTVFMTS